MIRQEIEVDEENFSKMTIQWFPGHMTKAQRMIEENMKLVDCVCEVLDARIPYSSRNPDIDRLAGEKPRLIILNRCDQADSRVTEAWKILFAQQGIRAIETDAASGRGVNGVAGAIREVLNSKIKEYAEKGQSGRPLRVMILGIPNVGKSTLINKIAGRKAAISGNKPGVTRGKQWINIDRGLDLLDTPGILWPKFENQHVGEMLAVTNAIKSEVVDCETLAANFMIMLSSLYPETIMIRYRINDLSGKTGFELLEEAAQHRGFLISKGEYDIERMANTLLKEFQDGKLGRITLEEPNAYQL